MTFNGDAKGKWVDMCISESVVTWLIDTHAIVLEIGRDASSPWGQAFQLSRVRHAFAGAYFLLRLRQARRPGRETKRPTHNNAERNIA